MNHNWIKYIMMWTYQKTKQGASLVFFLWLVLNGQEWMLQIALPLWELLNFRIKNEIVIYSYFSFLKQFYWDRIHILYHSCKFYSSVDFSIYTDVYDCHQFLNLLITSERNLILLSYPSPQAPISPTPSSH